MNQSRYGTARLKATDLSRTASTSDIIFDALREAIIRGEIGEGETIRQENVARMFNVSRIPVREALKRLEARGLVTSVRFKGVVVSALSPSEIQEIFAFRALLEADVIARAVPAMRAQSLEEARQYMEAFDQEEDPAKWGDLNWHFHMALYRDAGRPYFLEVIRTANDRVERYVRAQLELTGGRNRARSEHEAIFRACAEGDGEQAAALTRAHILDAGKSLIEFLTSDENNRKRNA